LCILHYLKVLISVSNKVYIFRWQHLLRTNKSICKDVFTFTWVRVIDEYGHHFEDTNVVPFSKDQPLMVSVDQYQPAFRSDSHEKILSQTLLLFSLLYKDVYLFKLLKVLGI
jgi:hypothetical protein